MPTNEKTTQTFLEWLLSQEPRNDHIGYYARAVIDDFNQGLEFNLVGSAIPQQIDTMEISNFSNYCRKNNIDTAFANVLILGHVMAIMEFNVGILTGIIPHPEPGNEESNLIRQRIATCCDMIPAILQDIDSDMKAEGLEPPL